MLIQQELGRIHDRKRSAAGHEIDPSRRRGFQRGLDIQDAFLGRERRPARKDPVRRHAERTEGVEAREAHAAVFAGLRQFRERGDRFGGLPSRQGFGHAKLDRFRR